MNPAPHGAQAGYGLAAVTILIWAGFVVVSRHGAQSALAAVDITALRVGAAALVLSPWWLPRLFRPALRRLRIHQSAVFALLAGIGYPLLAYGAFMYAPATHGAVLISGLMPFFTTSFAFLLLRERPSRMRLLGLALIAGGVVALFSAHLGGSDGRVLIGDLLFMAASATWALFGVLLKRWNVRAFDVTLGVVAWSALVYLPLYALLFPGRLAQAAPADLVTQALFQGVIVVCVAMWTYARAAELIGPSRLAVLTSLVPATATLMAVPLLGESLNAATACGVALTSAGALVGALSRRASPAPSR